MKPAVREEEKKNEIKWQMKNCCCGQEVVDFQVPRGEVWLSINSEPLSLAPQQMKDKSRNDCQSLVLARKCVCQTPPPCAGTVSKGISPKGGAFSPPYGMSHLPLAGLLHCGGDLVGQKADFAPCGYPQNLAILSTM